MVEAEVVRQVRILADAGWGAKRIAAEVGIARNTVRRYVRGGSEAERQERPRARRLDDAARIEARRLFDGAAGGNAVVVRRMLAAQGIEAGVRCVQRVVENHRRQIRAAQAASVRFETAPGAQMQIDFGQKRIGIGGELVVVHLLVAVLSYSRRLFVKPFLAERGEDWREGIAAAFRHFGGVTETILGDNPRALVRHRDRQTQTVVFHPAYVAFCRDFGVVPRACGPYRARTKGKTESGVKYVKQNGLANRDFESFASLEHHLSTWMVEADQREHGTTHEAPIVRFERDERHRLRALPDRPIPVRQRRLERRVALDALIDVDTVRYSVPHRLVRDRVEVLVAEDEVRIFHGTALVATHRRSPEPYARVVDPEHYEGLWRRPIQQNDVTSSSTASPLAALGRSLHDYAAVVDGGVL
jgi:transposase